MNKINIKKVSKVMLFVDFLLLPVVKILGKFNADSVQETHAWHLQKIDPDLIDLKKTLRMPSDDKSIHQRHRLFLFHAPLLGGWTKYTIYKVGDEAKLPFHIGWIEYNNDGSAKKALIHKLPIHERKIRLLNGTPYFHIETFAISAEDIQVPIQSSGGGILGENKDSDIRLF